MWNFKSVRFRQALTLNTGSSLYGWLNIKPNITFWDNKSPAIQMKNEMIRSELGEEGYEMYQMIKEIKQMKGVQARMPFTIELN